jgi:hypothetical protein
MAKQMKTFNN